MEENSSMDDGFVPPSIVSTLGKAMSSTRFYGSTNFGDLVSPYTDDRKAYANGLIIFASIVGAILVFWVGILVILKCKGESVGCASGMAFQVTKDKPPDRSSETHPSTDAEDSEHSIETGALYLDEEDENNEPEQAQEQPASTDDEPKEQDKVIDKRRQRRQRRCRIAFLVCGLICLLCACMSLAFSFSPSREALVNSDELLEEAQDVVNEVEKNILSASAMIDKVNATMSNMTLGFNETCLGYNNSETAGKSIKEFRFILSSEFDKLKSDVAGNMTEINRTMASIQDAIKSVEETAQTSRDRIWVLPSLLICVCVATTAVMVATILAWVGDSSPAFQKRIAYGVFPIFMIVCILCWIGAIGAAIGTIITADACTDPDSTVQTILQKHDFDENSTTFEYFVAYTSGCRVDPTIELDELKDEMLYSIDSIWRQISMTDKKREVPAQCQDSVDELMLGARTLVRGLTAIRKSIISAIYAAECGRIHAIYVEIVHDALCTDGSQAVAWLFILFSIAAICMMVMASLRASMYNPIEVEEVYDESEVAENMVLNEYEEYLEYIAKYKHEWQEYRGITSETMSNSQEGSQAGSIQSEAWTERGDEGTISDSDLEAESWPMDENAIDESDSEHDYGSIESTPTDDISFLSLGTSPTAQEVEDDPLAMPTVLNIAAVGVASAGVAAAVAASRMDREEHEQEPIFFSSPARSDMAETESETSSQTDNISFPSLKVSSLDAGNEEQNISKIPSLLGPTTTTALPLREELREQEPIFFDSDDSEETDGNVEVQLPTETVAKAPMLDDEYIHNSLYYIQSSFSDQRDEHAPWASSFSDDTTDERRQEPDGAYQEQVEVTIPSDSARNRASPEVLDDLKYYSRSELASPKSRNISKASPKLKMVVQKFEL